MTDLSMSMFLSKNDFKAEVAKQEAIVAAAIKHGAVQIQLQENGDRWSLSAKKEH